MPQTYSWPGTGGFVPGFSSISPFSSFLLSYCHSCASRNPVSWLLYLVSYSLFLVSYIFIITHLLTYSLPATIVYGLKSCVDTRFRGYDRQAINQETNLLLTAHRLLFTAYYLFPHYYLLATDYSPSLTSKVYSLKSIIHTLSYPTSFLYAILHGIILPCAVSSRQKNTSLLQPVLEIIQLLALTQK